MLSCLPDCVSVCLTVICLTVCLSNCDLSVSPAGHLYVTCLIQNCSDKLVSAQFLGKIDHSSLLVQDDYIFVKVTTTATCCVCCVSLNPPRKQEVAFQSN